MLKNTTLFFLLLIITSFTYAQKFASGYYNNSRWSYSQNNWKVDNSVYEEYDNSGNLLVLRNLSNQGNTLNETIYTYNSLNQKTSHTVKILQNGDLVNYLSYTYTYHKNGEYPTTLYQRWDTTLNQWQNVSLNTILYDDYNQIIENKFEAFSNNDLILLNKEGYIHTYNANKLISTYRYFTNLISGSTYQSDTTNRIIYKYNINNLLIEKIEETKDVATGSWMKKEKIELFYENDKVNRMIHYSGNSSINWQTIYMLDSITWKKWTGDYFNESNIKERYLRYEWNSSLGQFEFNEIRHRVYYFNTESFDEFHLSYNPNTNSNDTTIVHTELYDENNNIVLNADYYYKKGGIKTAFDGYRNLYVYSKNRKITDLIFQRYSISANNFENINRKQLMIATNIKNYKKENIIKVYPNPGSGQLHIDFNTLINKDETLIIYDINGRLIQEHPLPPLTKNYTINNLTEGMYILKFRDITEMLIVTGN